MRCNFSALRMRLDAAGAEKSVKTDSLGVTLTGCAKSSENGVLGIKALLRLGF